MNAEMMSPYSIQPRLLLPLMIFVGVLIIGVRASDVWNMIETGRVFEAVTPSQAATENKLPDIQTPTMVAPSATKDSATATSQQPATAATTTPKVSASPGPAIRREDNDASMESELVRQLTERRDQLDQRARALDTREALLKVGEQRVDQKIKEMETLRAQLQAMVNQASAAQQTQIDNLVKIYETMKPPEAAKIFETLELPVVLGVVQRMKPARTAAIMAAMAPEKAKEITVALTKQDQLPTVK